ncbi:MAG TPA: hypothetical protein VMN60_04750 [Longimicrobiales bacterium]|nr:hypothetical protein [Longimicrobiales bacterium]
MRVGPGPGIVSLLLCACTAASDDAPAAARDTTVATPGDTAAEAAVPEPPDSAADVRNAQWTVGVTDVSHDVTGAATLRAVRTARHAGYDRIVFDFGTAGLPAYHIEYIDRPVRQCGSGDTVSLAGDAWLQIRMEPAYAHTDAGQPTIPERALVPALPNLKELVLTCDFEAQVEWVGGMAMPSSYRVLELSAPSRLVVDVSHAVSR